MSSSAFPRALPLPAHDGHKGDAGRLRLWCGSRWMPGAALLAARAALRGGAGLVALACLDPEQALLLGAGLPEATASDWSGRDPEGEARCLRGATGDRAWLAGPGLGDTARTRALVARLLQAAASLPLVLDADALNALDGKPELLRERAARGPLVITPHPGEAARLLGRAIGRAQPLRRAAAAELAERSGALVVLKGAGTWIAQGERLHQNESGHPAMATAGAGDVLAGLLCAWLAHCGPGREAFELTCAAVQAHGRAGELAAQALGGCARGLLATDLIEQLPRAELALAQRSGRMP